MLIKVNCLASAILISTCTMVAWAGNMTARYEFEGNLADSSGNGYTGTVAAGTPTYVAGRTGYGQAVQIEPGDSVTWANLPKPAAISASIWVKLDPNSPNKSWLLDDITTVTGLGWRGWQFKLERAGVNTLVHWIVADNAGVRQTTTAAVADLYSGQWHHLVGTHDGATNAKLYVDGSLVAQKTTSTFAPAPYTKTLRLNNTADDQFYGNVDDLSLWDRALTAAEVQSLFVDGSINIISVTPGSQTATALEGYAAPAPTLQSYTVTNKDSSSPHTITIAEVDAAGSTFNYSWLSLSAAQLFIPAGANATLAATINHVPTGLLGGVHTAYVMFRDDSTTPAELIRKIELTVIGCQWSITPSTIRRSYFHGSSAPVLPVVCTITNTGKHGLTYTVQEVVNEPWVTLNTTSGGPLSYKATGTVTVSISPAGLPVGDHFCDLRFTNNCSPADQVVVRVNLSVVDKSNLPFVISYYDNGFESIPVNDLAYSTLAACGMNVVNATLGRWMAPWIDPDLAQKHGLKCMIDWDYDGGGTVEFPYDPAAIDANARGLANTFGSHPATMGYRLRDEPGADEWPQIALAHDKLLEYDPDCLPWVNILPNYSYQFYTLPSHKQYIDSYMKVVQPKVLCMDEYVAAGNTTYPPDVYSLYGHWSNLERFREYGLAYHLPYWKIIESNLVNTSPNTDGIYRFQTYSALAYGFTGILYFTYTTQGWGSDLALAYGKDQPGTWGAGTSKYSVAQAINHEVRALAPTLSKLTSWSVHHTKPNMSPPYTVPAEDIETFLGLDNFYVTSITGGDMAYGTFVDRSYRTYLMFVNQDYVNGHTFTIGLHPTHVAGLGRVSKTTGRLVPTSTPGNTLTVTLSAGNGELYKVLLDNSPASTPANLILTQQNATQALLNWSDSSDPQTGVSYYVVYRDGDEVGTPQMSQHTDIGLQPAATYEYSVAAVNGEGVESARSAPVRVSLLLSPADLDGDGDVDGSDFEFLYGCALGPNVPIMDGCGLADLDDDGDVDQSDFGVFQRCYSGQDIPGPLDCAD